VGEGAEKKANVRQWREGRRWPVLEVWRSGADSRVSFLINNSFDPNRRRLRLEAEVRREKEQDERRRGDLFGDDVSHGDVFTIPVVVHFLDELRWKDFEVIVKVSAMEEAGFGQDDGVDSIPPGVLPSQISILIGSSIVGIHARSKPNQSSLVWKPDLVCSGKHRTRDQKIIVNRKDRIGGRCGQRIETIAETICGMNFIKNFRGGIFLPQIFGDLILLIGPDDLNRFYLDTEDE
jgi:hypothetical protein